MTAGYSYELWNGKKVLGYYWSLFPIHAKWLIVPELSILKQPYGQKINSIKVPVITRIVSSNPIDIHYRVCLDVRRKSKRQIDILKGNK